MKMEIHKKRINGKVLLFRDEGLTTLKAPLLLIVLRGFILEGGGEFAQNATMQTTKITHLSKTHLKN